MTFPVWGVFLSQSLSPFCRLWVFKFAPCRRRYCPIIRNIPTSPFWKKLNVQFDAIYTGYLGSPKQIQIVSDFINDFRHEDSLIVADPVLGDNGRLYTNFDMEMVKEMRHLIKKADVVTPNMTELFYLLDKPYKADNTDEELKEYLRLLSDKGPLSSQVFLCTMNLTKPRFMRTTVREIVTGK